jgi:RimJ/RimL family protein N-acetyltransferase
MRAESPLMGATSFPLDLELRVAGFTLSRPREQDVPELVAACQDPDIVRFTVVPSPYDTEQGEGFVRFAAEAFASGSGLPLLVRDGDGRVLASCGLVDVGWMDAVCEVGYWVAPGARGRGIATAATAALCAWVFDATPLRRIELQAATINAPSLAVARTLGFTREGIRRSAGVQRVVDDPDPPRLDMAVHGLLVEERGRVDEVVAGLG